MKKKIETNQKLLTKGKRTKAQFFPHIINKLHQHNSKFHRLTFQTSVESVFQKTELDTARRKRPNRRGENITKVGWLLYAKPHKFE